MTPTTAARTVFDVVRASGATPSALAARRNRRTEDLLAFVRRQSRFYADHYADVPAGETALDAYPPVTKPQLMASFDDVVTDTAVTRARVDAFLADPANVGHAFLDDYVVWTTSGTTGEPGIFLHDRDALVVYNALAGVRASLPWVRAAGPGAFLRNGGRTALVAATGGHYLGVSGVRRMQRTRLLWRQRATVVDATDPLDRIVARLNAFQPALFGGYPTVVRELAREQRAGRLRIDPALVVLSGESISPAGIRAIRDAFGAVTRSAYSATEFPEAVALECEAGRLHVNSDWVVLEPVDGNHDPVPPGEPSDTVLLTNLANRIQPVVRYDLGDSVTLREAPCPCGSPFPVVDIAGRQGEVLRFESDDGEPVPVFPLALSSVVEAVPGVRRVQLVRTGRRTLRVRLDVAAAHDEATVRERVDAALRAFFAERSVTDLTVEWATTPPQREPGGGKFRHVWSDRASAPPD